MKCSMHVALRRNFFILATLAAIGCNVNRPEQPRDDASVFPDAGSGGSGATPDAGYPVCVVDFPCFGRKGKCVGFRQIQPYEDVSCHEACGDRPCSGGGCRPAGDIIDCRADQRCTELSESPGREKSARCVSYDAGTCDDADAGPLETWGCEPEWGCGDGETRNEGCDDGNRIDGDGCDRNCHLEAGFEYNNETRAFIWDEICGTRELLAALGDVPERAGWRLYSAVAVSADGSIVAGDGSFRGRKLAYVAHVPQR